MLSAAGSKSSGFDQIILNHCITCPLQGVKMLVAMPETVSLVPNAVAIIDLGDIIVIRRGQSLAAHPGTVLYCALLYCTLQLLFSCCEEKTPFQVDFECLSFNDGLI